MMLGTLKKIWIWADGRSLKKIMDLKNAIIPTKKMAQY